METKAIKSGGRPAKNPIEKQQRVVSTKLSKPHFYAIQKRAKEAGISLSEYVRQAILTGKVIPRLSREDADVLRKLSGEANNLNQLAKQANTAGFIRVAEDLLVLKQKLVELIARLSKLHR